jgi:cobalt-zinc-cadmium efflux system outer membrane protein
MKKRISVIALAVAALSLRAAAPDGASVVGTNLSLTPDALVAEALERNPELKFYEAEVSAAKAGRRSAGIWANPELSTSVGQKTVRGGGLHNEGVAWAVSVLQPF